MDLQIKSLAELKQSFEHILDQTSNHKYLIEIELQAIRRFTSEKGYRKFKSPFVMATYEHIKCTFPIKHIQVFKSEVFDEVFDKYVTGTNFKLEDYHKRLHLSIKQAIELAKYYNWLNTLLENNKKVVRKTELTHKQKMLALHYLGLDLSKYDNTKSAKILSLILNLDEGNTRKYLSYLSAGTNDVRTKPNLSKLSKIFKDQGFDDIAFTIKSDLDKMK